MSRIQIEDYDSARHPNPMQWFDDAQRKRHDKAPTLVRYPVCLVTVKGFTFIFHSVEQIRIAIDYYDRKTHRSSRLPVYTQNLGGDHWETQRWFDRLPQFLLERGTREEVVSVLNRAMDQYSKFPEASTGAVVKPYFDTW